MKKQSLRSLAIAGSGQFSNLSTELFIALAFNVRLILDYLYQILVLTEVTHAVTALPKPLHDETEPASVNTLNLYPSCC